MAYEQLAEISHNQQVKLAVGLRLQTALYEPAAGPRAHDANAIVMLTNEIASPLYGPNGTEGNFGEFSRFVANDLKTPVFAVQRIGSADAAYDRWTHNALAPGGNRANTVHHIAETALLRLVYATPHVKRLIIAGHSAGATHATELTRAIGEHDLLSAVGLDGTELTGLVTSDALRHRHTVLGGAIRYAAYNIVEPRWFGNTIPPRSPDEQDRATTGIEQRSLWDIVHNRREWARGIGENLDYIIKHMPYTAVHAAVMQHSPNNTFHTPGQLQQHVDFMNATREHRPGAAPCHAELLPMAHGAGSRPKVMAAIIRGSGLVY